VDLADRAAVITGGSRGLGRAIAARFVAEGASVLIVARDPGPLEQARAELAAHAVRPGQSVHALAADVALPDTADAVAALAAKELPDLAVLVNNAGVYGPFGAVDEVPWEAWEHAVRVNLFGPVLLSRALVPALRRRGFGKIVNVSGGGATSPLPRISAYAAAKAALVRLTETFACELRADRIDVNALAPGPLDTRLLDELLAAGPEGVGPEMFARARRQREEGGTPLAKGADLALFLASARSDGITGRLLSAIWDDWASLPARREEIARSDAYTLRRVSPGGER
jgi:3-oxoacyl-[acyl-carrier protein] reductase